MLSNCGAGSLDSKEIKPVNPKGNQPWIFIGRTNTEAEAPILWPPEAKSWLTGEDSDVKDWEQEEKGVKGDEMVGWHHRIKGHSWRKLWGIVTDREAWWVIVHGVTESQTWFGDWTTTRRVTQKVVTFHSVDEGINQLIKETSHPGLN